METTMEKFGFNIVKHLYKDVYCVTHPLSGDQKLVFKKCVRDNNDVRQKLQQLEGVQEYIFSMKDSTYLVFKYYEGMDLIDVANSQDPKISFKQRKAIVKDIGVIIKNMHSIGIVHRDIKLDNIVYDNATKTTTLIDIDYAAFSSNYNVHCVDGTLHYIDPDYFIGGGYKNENAMKMLDVWAFGVVIYEFLTKDAIVSNGGVVRWRDIKTLSGRIKSWDKGNKYTEMNSILSKIFVPMNERVSIDKVCEMFEEYNW